MAKKHMKRCSTSLSENQNYNEVSLHTSQNGHHQKNLQTVNAGEGVEKRESSCMVSGNVNWYSHYGEQVWRFLKKLKIELSYDLAVPLLGIYVEKTIIEKDTCTPMLTDTLFTISRTGKQSTCSSAKEWIKKMWYICTLGCYSAIERNEIAESHVVLSVVF